MDHPEPDNDMMSGGPIITITRGDGKAESAQPLMDKNLDNSFDRPGPGGGGGDLDQMETSELFKASQDSFAQFAASGDFCFDTQRCDFSELQAQLEKEEEKAVEKFDFQLLIQT